MIGALQIWKKNSHIEFEMHPPKPDKEVIIKNNPIVFAILKFDEQVNEYYFAKIRIGF